MEAEAPKPQAQPSGSQVDANRKREQAKEKSTSHFTGNKARSIFAWRLPKDTTNEDVRSFFCAAGQVKTVKIVPDNASASRDKVAAYVEFNQEESVQKAVALKGKQLRGSPVAVKPAEESGDHAVPGTSERRSRSIRARRTNPSPEIPSKRVRSPSPGRRRTSRRHRSDSESYSYTSRSEGSLSRSPVRKRRDERRGRRNRSYDSADDSYDSSYSSRSRSRNRRRYQRSRSRGSSSDRSFRRERRYGRRDHRRERSRSRSPRGRYIDDRDERETRYLHHRRSRRDDRYFDERDWRDERDRYSRHDDLTDDYRRRDRYRRGPEDYRRGRDSPSYYHEESPPPKRRRRAPRVDRGRDKPAAVEGATSKDLVDEQARTVLAWQLPLDSTEEELRALFSASGNVRHVKLVPDKISGERDKLAAYVEFDSKKSAVRAVSRKEVSLGGHLVRLRAMTDFPNEKVIEKGSMGNHENPNGHPNSGKPKARNEAVAKSSGRRPARDVDGDPPRKRSDYGTQMISIEELKKLLNPYGLPPPEQKEEGSPGGQVLEPAKKVPLPTAGSGTLDAPMRNGNDTFTRLYVGSIPFELSESDVRAIFEPFGQMESLTLQRDAAGKSLGYGFVHFVKHESAKNALKANGMAVMGRNLKIGLTGQGQGQIGGAKKSNKGAVVPLPKVGGAQNGRKELNGELDEGNDGGLAMNAGQRAMLMQQLSRGKAMGGNLDVTLKEVSSPTKSLMLGNMFNPKLESAGFEIDLTDDVREECEKRYGEIEHIFVEKDSQGIVFVRFASLEGSSNGMKGLQGRWFGGLQIRASYVADEEYEKRFPEAKGK